MSQKYLRNFCATINNPTDADKSAVKKLECTYYCIGNEGKDSTPHLQMYLELSKKTSFAKLKQLLPRAHIEARRGSAQQASNYCKKEGDYEEHGTISKQGQRNDLTDFVHTVKADPTINQEQLIENHTCIMARYPAFVHKVISTYNKPQTLDWENGDSPNLWVYGPPGTGKTREYQGDNVYYKLHNKWWDNYNGEETVLMDDVDPDCLRYLGNLLKAWLDRYPFRAEIKGSSVVIRPARFVITSNYSIGECFPREADRLAIQRRVRVIHKVF